MVDLTSLIRYFRYQNYKSFGENGFSCPYYKGNDQCDRPNGCRCRKLAEIRGHIDYIIPKEYRDKNFNNITGFVVGKDGKQEQVWSEKTTKQICASLKSYLFGEEDDSTISDREGYNRISKLDKRFSDGSSIIIHGNPARRKKENNLLPMPTGKTFLACIILKEAIWRRMYSTNKADTYAIVSYQTLRHDLKLKSERANDLKEFDWLVVDDMSLPINETDFNHQSFIANFDDFLMTRMDNRLPTIFCCDFDVLAKDYTDLLGYSFQKIIGLNNTWLVKAGD